MKLYDNPFSPFARKVWMVLRHKGLAFDCVDGLHADARAELADRNPRVEVPVLEDDGVVVVNSPHLSAVKFLDLAFSPEKHPNLYAWYGRVRKHPVFAADLARVKTWLASVHEQPKLQRIVWRGDRIEWLLANGGHRWFMGEIESGRVAWPRRDD